MGTLISTHQAFLAVIATFLTTVWLISLFAKDTSIMDIAYPLTAALPTLWIVWNQATWGPHEIICLSLVFLWATRLAGHIGLRNLPHGEDARYAAWRRRHGRHWWWWSLFQVFVLQGVMVSLWSIPLVFALDTPHPSLGWPHIIACGLFSIGFYFQAVSDHQLEQFRRTRTSPHAVLNTGLWALSRHPNYFGEALIWWSFGFLGLTHPWGWVGLLAPAYVTWFMSQGSATPMQERYLAKKKPGYDQYVATVPKFFPKLSRS
jgi:steroid 5-alpha reductase family enzyme